MSREYKLKTKIIYLTGFMGSGKTTIGHILANKIGWDFLDLDKVIESETGKKIPLIFETDGEEVFRNLETEFLKKIMTREQIIISLGGGTIAYNNNIELLKKSGRIVYLKTSAEKVYLRLRYKTDRPILTMNEETDDKTQVLEKINKLMENREVYYSQADIVFKTENITMGKAVDSLARMIDKYI